MFLYSIWCKQFLFNALPLFYEPPKSKYYRQDDSDHGENDTCMGKWRVGVGTVSDIASFLPPKYLSHSDFCDSICVLRPATCNRQRGREGQVVTMGPYTTHIHKHKHASKTNIHKHASKTNIHKHA